MIFVVLVEIVEFVVLLEVFEFEEVVVEEIVFVIENLIVEFGWEVVFEELVLDFEVFEFEK